jgi:N6-L-threonylcarbamoyladenine synthase|tara:strand:+ start:2305 stop:3384 length:1080 start_codon:yes stop_codon:yes gene_type:complete
MKKVRILGIESSCDETSVAVIERSASGKIKILSNIVKSQLSIHKNFGGVVPELAARAHSDIIDELILIALKEAKIKLKDLSAIAATSGPGLLGGLLVGVVAAKTLASVLKIPFIAINHLEGHALSVQLEKEISYPYLLLLVSGGHTEFTIINKFNSYKRIGTTIDDALGEAFDKTARLLNLGYPGGPEIEKIANSGNENKFNLPKPLIHENNCHFSFSGLKSAIAQIVAKHKINLQFKKDMAASFQKTIVDIISVKTERAITIFEKIKRKKGKVTIVVAGGVAANQYLRASLKQLEQNNNCEFFFPSMKLCTDNGAMIALAGLERYERKLFSKLSFKPRPRWPLDKKAEFMKGKRRIGI